MKTFANWMTVIFMTMYWIFRIFITYMQATGRDFPVVPINTTTEIALLFITFICIAMMFKRVRTGAVIYLVSYLLYFGVDLYYQIIPLIKGETFSIEIGSNMFASIIAVILALAVMIDALSENIKAPEDSKTEWFYANKDLDRKTDDRDDKNNYRIM